MTPIRWVPLVTAPDQLTAELWQQILTENDIPAVLKAGDAVSFMGLSSFPVRLMVPEEREADAAELLREILSATPIGEDMEPQ